MTIDKKFTDMDLFHPMRLFVRSFMAKFETKDIKIDNLHLMEIYFLWCDVMNDKRATGTYWGQGQECLDEYIKLHPDTIFRSNKAQQIIMHYCPKCHKLMKKYWDIEKGDYYKCKDCEDD